MVIDYIGDRRVPLALVVIGIAATIGVHEWADVHYMPFSLAQAGDKALAKQIEANSQLLRGHIDVYELNENKKAIRLVQDQQFTLVQFEKVNGANDMTIKRAEELRRELVDLQDKKTCLLNGNDNCK